MRSEFYEIKHYSAYALAVITPRVDHFLTKEVQKLSKFFSNPTHAWHKKLLGTYSSEWMQQSVWVIKKLLSGASFPYSCLGKTNKSITSSYKSVPSSVKLSMMHHYQHVDTGWEDHLKQFVPKSTTMSQRFSLTKGKNDWAKILADLL